MRAARCTSQVRLEGKTVIITGANTGIGKETARDLARRGGRVILACRNLDKARAAVSDITATVPNAQLIIKHLNLASLASVRLFAADICRNEQRLDILINNAGVGGIKHSKTEDGLEVTLGVNHFGHFLLTNLLLPLLKTSAPSRIVNVASHAHIFYNIDFSDLTMDKSYGPMKAYCRSKLANVLFTRELAKRLEGTGVTSYSLHPGVIHTELPRHLFVMRLPVLSTVLSWLSRVFLKTAEEGCQTTLYCALTERLAHESGLYYSNCGLSMPTMTALHEGHAKLLWRLSAELVGLPYEKRQDSDSHTDTDSDIDNNQ